MKRITTDNPTGNFDTLMNYCFGKDQQATLQYAGGKTDIPLHAYIAPFCKQKHCIEDENISMEDLSEVILDPMGDCSDCPYGILYYLGCQAAEVRGRLKRYEDTGCTVTDDNDINDGYHTFKELYHHRAVLFSVICNTFRNLAWKSWKHYDGTMFDGFFIVGVATPKGYYTYHYKASYWDMFNVKELLHAPEWDGHQPKDVDRLLSLTPKKINYPVVMDTKTQKCVPVLSISYDENGNPIEVEVLSEGDGIILEQGEFEIINCGL
jgi:hypothetical protein